MNYIIAGFCFILAHMGFLFWSGVGRAMANLPGFFGLYAALLPAGAFLLGIGAGFCIGLRIKPCSNKGQSQCSLHSHRKKLTTVSLVGCFALYICCMFIDIASIVVAYRFAISLLLFIIGLAASLIESRCSAKARG